MTTRQDFSHLKCPLISKSVLCNSLQEDGVSCEKQLQKSKNLDLHCKMNLDFGVGGGGGLL